MKGDGATAYGVGNNGHLWVAGLEESVERGKGGGSGCEGRKGIGGVGV